MFFKVVGLDDNLDIFFCWEEFTLAQARQAGGFYAGQVARAMPGRRGRGGASMPGRFAETVGLDSFEQKNSRLAGMQLRGNIPQFNFPCYQYI